MTEENKSLIEFPTRFALKAMGKAVPEFQSAVLAAVQQYAPDTQAESITVRPSSQGNYVGATIDVYVENQEQLDNIYRALTSHELVKVVF